MSMPMNTKYIFTALLLAHMLTASAAGQGTDTLQYAVNEHASCLLSLRQNVFFNPAMQRFHYATSLNVLSAAYQHDKASHPVRLEMGSGHNHGCRKERPLCGAMPLTKTATQRASAIARHLILPHFTLISWRIRWVETTEMSGIILWVALPQHWADGPLEQKGSTQH